MLKNENNIGKFKGIFMKIALLVPSRERIQNRLNLINSIKDTISDINNITLYLGIDEDDPTRDAAIELCQNNKFIKIIDIKNDHKMLNLGILWNICANKSTEDIISMIGDDMVFMTKNWDKEIIMEFSPSQCPDDNFKMVHCYDGRWGKKIAVNLFINRKYMDLTGYFMREEFPIDVIDIWLQQIYLAFNRLKYREDIHIDHRHWSYRKSPKDDVAKRRNGGGNGRISVNLWSELLPERLKEAIMISEKLHIPFKKELINNNMMF